MSSEKKLFVNELFTSIQGESSFAGELCFFVRLSGCNLRCRFCDTQYSWSLEDGKAMTLDEIVGKAIDADVRLVEITGGEPLLQPNTVELCERLLYQNRNVLVETNGSRPIDILPEGVIRVMDCKLPSSGEADNMDTANFAKLSGNDEVKFVVADRDDYVHAKRVVAEYDLIPRVKHVLCGVAFGKLAPQKLVDWIIEDRLQVRFQLQLHKIIWDPQKRGV